jgi:hypothetical protein
MGKLMRLYKYFQTSSRLYIFQRNKIVYPSEEEKYSI